MSRSAAMRVGVQRNSLVAAAVAAITDDFTGSGDNAGQTTKTGGLVWVQGSGYVAANRSGGTLVSSNGSTARNVLPVTSSAGTVQALCLGNAAGIEFHSGSSGNDRFYFGSIGSTNWRVGKYVSGTFTRLDGVNLGSSGTAATLKVVFSTTEALFFVNDVQVFSTTDAALNNLTYTDVGVLVGGTSTVDDFAFTPA